MTTCETNKTTKSMTTCKTNKTTEKVCVILYMHPNDSFLQVDDELEIKAYYAGHVLGAAMFHLRVGQQSLVYTVSNVLVWSMDNKCKIVFITQAFSAQALHWSQFPLVSQWCFSG